MKEPKKTPEPVKTGFAIRKVVTEIVPLSIGTGDKSPGQLLDEMLSNSALAGEDIQMIEIFFDPADWNRVKEMYL